MLAITITTARDPASTRTLAHSTGSRRGTAANVLRIIPFAYSLLMISTPRMPTISCARVTPARLIAVGSALAKGPRPPPPPPLGPVGVTAPDATEAANAPNAISSSPDAAIMMIHERTDRSLIHSERITRRWVTARSERSRCRAVPAFTFSTAVGEGAAFDSSMTLIRQRSVLSLKPVRRTRRRCRPGGRCSRSRPWSGP